MKETGTVKRTTQPRTAAKRARKPEPRSTPPRSGTAAKAVQPSPAPAPVGAASAVKPTEAQIAERAYYLSLDPHRSGGPLDDWLQAERDLRNGSAPQ
jgi:cell division protein FtsN